MPSLSKLASLTLGAVSSLDRRQSQPVVGIDTPVMGYNSYNDVACSPTEARMSSTIDAMVRRGLRDAGYRFFQIDCGWQSPNGTRSKNAFGAIDVDEEHFPNGIAPVSKKARDNGFVFSMYSGAGVRSCDTISPTPRLGSYGYEIQDAKQFASWGVQYVKYDYCYADGPSESQNAPKDPRRDYVDRYRAMWDALQAVSIPRMLICQWGTPYLNPQGHSQGPVEWADPISTSFRLSDDITKDWVAVTRIINQSIYIAREAKSGKSHFADADMLEVGASQLSIDEQRTHFAYWAMYKSALMIGSDVANLPAASVEILLNRDLISINQDSLAKPVVLVQRYTNDRDLFRGPLANGDDAVLLINAQNAARSQMSIDLRAELGIASADVKDLWTGQVTRGVTGVYSRSSVAAHGSVALRLSNIQRAATSSPTVAWVEAEAGQGGAKASCAACSGGTKVGNVGNGSGAASTLTLTGLTAAQATSTVLFDYLNAEIGYLGGQGQNARSAFVSVNGNPTVEVSFPISGYDWGLSVAKDYRVQLSGFRAGRSDNTIAISNTNAFAPDFDRVGIVQ